MIWSSWIQAVATSLNVTPTQAGIIISFVFTGFFVLLGLLASKGRKPEISGGVPAILGIVLFTFLNWLPIWTGSAIAILFALAVAYSVSDRLGR